MKSRIALAVAASLLSDGAPSDAMASSSIDLGPVPGTNFMLYADGDGRACGAEVRYTGKSVLGFIYTGSQWAVYLPSPQVVAAGRQGLQYQFQH